MNGQACIRQPASLRVDQAVNKHFIVHALQLKVVPQYFDLIRVLLVPVGLCQFQSVISLPTPEVGFKIAGT
jgi:hypothetical protein